MGEEFLGHLAALAGKLDFLATDPEARFTAAYRWGGWGDYVDYFTGDASRGAD